MATSRQSLNVTELDFDQIKKNLITYFSDVDSPFKDWNYSGSGLNVLLDMLAYNTHYNAVLAHMSINESFIDSAQLRSSVVSNAKLLGYIPSSNSAPLVTATVSFIRSAEGEAGSITSITLPKGSSFITKLNDVAYTYVTLDEEILPYDSGTGKFTKLISLYQGSLEKKTFQVNNVNANNAYQLDDSNIDLNTMIVKVYGTGNTSEAEVFTKFTDISAVDGNSAIYSIAENSLGLYEIKFGNGIFGKKLTNLSRIEVEYLSTGGSASNGATTFSFMDALPSYVTSNPAVAPAAASSGGNMRETIDSVRNNAPLSFITQNRAVTADDYKTLIYKNYSYAQSISVWGGEDNDPPQYGKAFISIKPYDPQLFLTASQKAEIKEMLKYKKVLSIIPELVDPEYIYITLDVLFKYNKNAANVSKGELETGVRSVISQYNVTNLESFNGVFRQSALSRQIDTYSPAILNSLVRVFVSNTFTIDPENPLKTTIKFGTSLVPEQGQVIIGCTPWISKGVNIYLGDEEGSTTSTRNIYTYYIQDGQRVKLAYSIGSLDMKTGIMVLEALYADYLVNVTIDLIPDSNDIAPNKNQLLIIKDNNVNVSGEVDAIAVGGSSRSVEYVTFKRDR